MKPESASQSGYVTDVAYTAGYYPHQAPWHLEAACLLQGVRPPSIGPGLSYLELGCGRGHGALILAASNPNWTVTAVDFRPAHVAEARQLAAEAGIHNAVFVEADLADPLTATLLPEADIVSLHGVWSWVPATVRRGIVDILAARLQPGGLVQVSYNSLPAWQGALGMQRMVREAGLRTAGRSDQQAMAGMQAVRDLAAAGAGYLGESRVVRNTLQYLDRFSAGYLAHEYMNAAWSPCFHSDVCADLGPAGLAWAGSAQALDGFPELSLTPQQRAVVDRHDDPLLRELMADMCRERSLRNDLFVRGPTRLDRAERDRQLREVVLAPAQTRAGFRFAVTVPVGEATLEPAFYGPVMDRLAEGPCTVGALLDLPRLQGQPRVGPVELVGMLLGSAQAIAVAPQRGERGIVAPALNHAIGARLAAEGALNAHAGLASEVLGTGWPCSAAELTAWRRASDPAVAGATMEQAAAEAAATLPPVWRALGLDPE